MFRNSLLIVSTLGFVAISACGDAGSTDATAPNFPAAGNGPGAPPTGAAGTNTATPPTTLPVGNAGGPSIIGSGGAPALPPGGAGAPGLPQPPGTAGAPAVGTATVPPPPAGFGTTATLVGDFLGANMGSNSGQFIPGNAFPTLAPVVSGGVGVFTIPFTAIDQQLVWNFRVTPTTNATGMEAVVGVYLANASLEPLVYGIAVQITASSDDPATPINPVDGSGEEFAFLGRFINPADVPVGVWTEFTLDLDTPPTAPSLFSPIGVNQIGVQVQAANATALPGIVNTPTTVTFAVAFAGLRPKGGVIPPMGTAGMGTAGMGTAGMGTAGMDMGMAGMDMGVAGMDMGVGGMAGAGM